jgi:lipopolysaccharide transport system permease protein
MGRTPSEAVWAWVGGIGVMRVNEELKYPAATTSSALPGGPATLIRIEAAKAWPSLRLGELWAYRELIYFLIWRDIKVRYKQTILGAGWAIVQPLFTMLLFSLFFGRLAKVPSDGIPYPLFSFTGLVPWSYFANGLTQASNSLVGNSSLIKKVYFPRLAIPTAKVLSALLDFGLAFILLIGMTFYYRIHPSIRILWVPLFLLLAMVTALGASFWLSALNVRIRDVEQTLPFLTQIWLFATPIAYPSSLLSEPWRTLYGINPMVGVVEGFRWALLGANTAPGPMLIISSLVATAMLVSGAFWFRRLEKTFADVL